MKTRELKSFFARLDDLDAEKAQLREDEGEVYAEAKLAGFDPKVMRRVQSVRRMDADYARSHRRTFDLYCDLMGVK